MDDFYITLRSDASPLEFSSNTTAKFSNNLPAEIRLTGSDWRIGLVSISYPYTFRNIRKNHNELIISALDDSENKQKIIFKIPEGYYQTVEEILKILNSQIRQKLIEINKLINYDREAGSIFSDTLTIDEKSLKVIVNKKIISEFRNIFKSVERIYFSGNLATIMGFDMERHDLQHNFESEHTANLNFGISPEIFLYINIIYPQLIGHTSSEVIEIFPTLDHRSKFSGIIQKKFPAPHYVKILTKNFRTIDVQLKNNLNEYIEFIFGTVTAVFHVKCSRKDELRQ